MKRISILSLICSMLLSSTPARAIELSLEENRAERGSVGYVDMRRLFTASPDATHAREGLEELVRQAEERVNSKKADLLRLRQELSTLKIERDELARSTPTASIPLPPAKPAEVPALAPVVAKPMAPTPAPKPVEPPKPVVAKPVETSVAVQPVTAAPPPAPAPVPAPAPAATTTNPPLTINLPGLTDGPLNLERPGGSPLNPTRAKPEPVVAAPTPAPAPAPLPVPKAPEPVAAPVIVSTPTAPVVAPVVVSTPTAPVVPAGPTLAQRLLELDGRIVAKQVEIDRVQADLDKERTGAERSLLDAEGRKTDQVLARLYRAISEVAKREGVSVVVDKSATLYGHPAVDLTDKILKQLRGVVPAQ